MKKLSLRIKKKKSYACIHCKKNNMNKSNNIQNSKLMHCVMFVLLVVLYQGVGAGGEVEDSIISI